MCSYRYGPHLFFDHTPWAFGAPILRLGVQSRRLDLDTLVTEEGGDCIRSHEFVVAFNDLWFDVVLALKKDEQVS